jgi:hypothetical protein
MTSWMTAKNFPSLKARGTIGLGAKCNGEGLPPRVALSLTWVLASAEMYRSRLILKDLIDAAER